MNPITEDPIMMTASNIITEPFDPTVEKIDLRPYKTKSVYIHDSNDPSNTNYLIYPDNKYF